MELAHQRSEESGSIAGDRRNLGWCAGREMVAGQVVAGQFVGVFWWLGLIFLIFLFKLLRRLQ